MGCCGPKALNILGISDGISPARHTQKSSQHVRACATGDGAICSKNRKIVPYRDSPIQEKARANGIRSFHRPTYKRPGLRPRL